MTMQRSGGGSGLSFFLAALSFSAVCIAQPVVPGASDPGAIQQRQIEEERRRQEAERLRRKPVTDPLKVPEEPGAAVRTAPEAVRFFVREIEFTKSEILTPEELQAIARDYSNRELSLNDLQALAQRVNALYRAKGVVTARAIVPPQDLTAGVVRIRLVEGRLGRVLIEGNDATREGYIDWRLGQTPGQLVDLAELERQLIRFNRTTDVQLRAELKPGTSFGTTDLLLQAAEPPRHDLRAFIDNSGSKGTGEWRIGLVYLNRSLLGFRDDLTLSHIRSDGHEGYSASYGVPWNRWGGRATFSYYKDYTEINHGPERVLDITGESEAYVLALRQPTVVTDTLQIDVTAGVKKRRSVNWISGVFLQGVETKDGNVGLELQSLDTRGYWLASYTVTSGGAESVAHSAYTIGRGSLRRIQDLGSGWSARAVLNFQHTGDELLPSSEQFFIGGEGSVRGYPVGVYSGDRGYAANLELHHPLGTVSAEGGLQLAATGFFFLDYGYVKPFRPPSSTLRSYEELSGAGWGVQASLGRRVSTRLTFAYAFNNLPSEDRFRVHFQLVASIF